MEKKTLYDTSYTLLHFHWHTVGMSTSYNWHWLYWCCILGFIRKHWEMSWFFCKKSHLIHKTIVFSLLDILKQRDDSGSCFLPPCLVDNLWSAYSEKGSIVEKKGQPSVAGSEDTKMGGLPYVFTDIMTYFTMLVGIYFPSVTGRYNYFSWVRMCTYSWKKDYFVCECLLMTHEIASLCVQVLCT